MDTSTLIGIIGLIIGFCGIVITIVKSRYDRKTERKKHEELMKAQYEMIKTLKQQQDLSQNPNLSPSEMEEEKEKLKKKESNLLINILKTVKAIGWASSVYEELTKDRQKDS